VLTRIFFGANSATKSPASFQAVHVPSYIIERAGTLKSRRAELSAAFQSKFTEEHQKLERLRQHCIAGKPEAINLLMKVSHIRHPLPSVLLKAFETNLDLSARVILCGVEIPDFAGLSIVRKRGTSYKAKWQPVSATERRRSVETILYGLCLRAAYLAANSDVANVFDTVAVNATQSWHDPATGKPCEGIIASLQAPKADLLQLHIGQLDAKACFRYLKGITTPSVDQISPVRPIFVMNTDDRRIIENRDVVDQLDREANLAAMPWEDFEHLVRQLFEWEFGRNGVEVKVTRASRDRGVDAIMFDPDPLRGGKYVLQAKRYTRPVDVAAVRDLYGTVVNEGANRGILVTTSSYGPDSYEFAKDKPLSLVDGPNLITMLRRHGRRFRIDLEEARRLGEYLP
jgi:restriction system protein